MRRPALADDSLNGVLRYAVEKQLPVQLILNGGIWADAALQRARVGRERPSRGGSAQLPVDAGRQGASLTTS